MEGDTVRMTYAEAAALFGCQEKSVSVRAKRRGWHREKGNDGRVRVYIPRDQMPDSPPDSHPDSHTVTGATIQEVKLQGEIKALQARLDAAEAMAEERARHLDDMRKLLERPRRGWWPFK